MAVTCRARRGRITTMEPGFSKIFEADSGDPVTRWSLLRAYFGRFCGVPMPGPGRVSPDVANIETEVGSRLPFSVREWMAFTWDLATDKSPSPPVQRAKDGSENRRAAR